MDFITVTTGVYLSDYKIKLTFNTGEEKIIDLKNELRGEVFEPLKNKSKFKNFSCTGRTIEWETTADFAPEFLYEKGVSV